MARNTGALTAYLQSNQTLTGAITDSMCGAKYDDECESGVMHARVGEAWLRLRALSGGKVYTLKRLVKEGIARTFRKNSVSQCLTFAALRLLVLQWRSQFPRDASL